MPTSNRRLGTVVLALLITVPGCGGEPSPRELKNRQEFEMLLTAVSLKDPRQLEIDARRIDDRHASGELSKDGFDALQEIISMAREGRWGEAEKRAYTFRETRPYFK